jgi:hypothetical protein
MKLAFLLSCKMTTAKKPYQWRAAPPPPALFVDLHQQFVLTALRRAVPVLCTLVTRFLTSSDDTQCSPAPCAAS